ncbi:hypothetical protein CDAR_87551 [Caerostris darwini]|uniref:Uncharacterized protein n=1 Tax=Caerostris darwini TaxID=1538125 RepID=A0AAV4X056_9ARAC|nr:hypothetical protein CDAR_87551 [Caerostris darwini]
MSKPLRHGSSPSHSMFEKIFTKIYHQFQEPKDRGRKFVHKLDNHKELRETFDANRLSQRNATESEIELIQPTDYSLKSTRTTSPSPARGRSPTQHYRLLSPC